MGHSTSKADFQIPTFMKRKGSLPYSEEPDTES
jgi:hypothetical protein